MDIYKKTGTSPEFYIEHDGIPLHMKLDFPESFTGEESEGECPLVIVQHGFTGQAEETSGIIPCSSGFRR